MITTIVLTVWGLASLALVVSNHRARQAATPTPPPPPDPNDTADDWDDVAVLPRTVYPPPVPAPAWDDLDEIAYRWFAEGSAR